jgi:PAS domain S-box-containing protein
VRSSARNLTPLRPRLITAAAGAYALIVGVLTMLGYALNVRRLTDWIDDGISMFPNAAACAILGGFALLLLTVAGDHKAWRVVLRVTSCIVGLVGGLTLLQHLADVNLGMDTLLFERTWGQRAAAAPMRMGPPASTSYLVIGTALLLGTRGPRAKRIAAALALVIVGIASLSLVGYWFGADHLFGVARFTGIALQTSSALAAIGIGLIASLPEYGLAAVLRRDDPGGVIVRRLLLPIIAIPLTLGWLRVWGQESGYFDTAFGTALLALAMILMLIAVLWWTATGVSRQAQLTRAAKEGVRESEARYRSLFEIAVYGVLTIDERGTIESANPAAEQLFGYSGNELIGRNVSMLMPEPYRREHDSYLGNYLRTGERKIIGIGREVVGLRRDGSRFPMDLAVSELLIGDKRYFQGTVNDITERKLAEEAERAARKEAEQASRIKDEFLATLSHELRTPLNAILGWSRIMESKRLDSKTIDEGIQVITRNAKIQADLIADLLDMSRIVSGKLRLEVDDVDLVDVVTAGIDSIRHSADAKGIRIQPILDSTLGPIRGDANRLQQVVWNLLSNAIKFTPKGGRITVSLAKKNSHAEITVDDTGIGIKEEFLPHLFERFRQADASTTRTHGGLGLGLAIVKHIVELHGGIVRADSQGEGRGASFTIELPLTVRRQSTLSAEGERGRSGQQSTLAACDEVDLSGTTILAIDDEADTRGVLRRILEECRARVVAAASADEGLLAVEQCRPNLILCDIGMPDKDGYAFIKQLRERGDTTPALAVTAFARSEDRLRALRAGYQGHVTKPVEPSELVATVAAFSKASNRLREHSEECE